VTKTFIGRFPIQLSTCIIALRNVLFSGNRGSAKELKFRLFKLQCYIN